MQIIDGRKVRDELLGTLAGKVQALSFKPVFCDVLVGENEVSAQYVRMKEKTAEALGLETYKAVFPGNISQDELVAEIKKIAAIPHMAGLIVQLPLPSALDTRAVLDAVPCNIDVDATGAETARHFYDNTPDFIFPTAGAVMHILDSLNIDLSQKKIVIAGQGMLVGKPVTHLLQNRGLQIEVVDKNTPNPENIFKTADILISAVGKQDFINGKDLKKDVIIVDAGSVESDGVVVGDVNQPSVADVASFISPVPGGVGPVTVAMLMKNMILSAEKLS